MMIVSDGAKDFKRLGSNQVSNKFPSFGKGAYSTDSASVPTEKSSDDSSKYPSS